MSRYSNFQVGALVTADTVLAGAGAALGSFARGGDPTVSSAIVGAGCGLLSLHTNFFAQRPHRLDSPPSGLEISVGFTTFEFLGAAIGYTGSKLFLDVCSNSSPWPFLCDAFVGSTITIGTYYCFSLISDYYYKRNDLPQLQDRSIQYN